MTSLASPRERHAQGGFALLEILVSLLLFSFGLLGFVALQARAVSISSDAQDRNRAALLANELASVMWITGSTAIADDTLTNWGKKINAGLPGGAGSVSSAGANSALITITWGAPSRLSSEAKQRYTTTVVLP